METSLGTLGIGLVGPGWIADPHVAGIEGSGVAKVTAITGGREERLAARSTQWGAPAEESLEALVDRDDVDAVWLLSPTPVHREQLEFLISRGVPVLVEKPATLTLDEAISVRALAREHEVFVMPGHNQIYQAEIEAARRLLADGALGTIVGANLTSVGQPPAELMEGWRKTVANPGGGAFADSGYHLAYLSMYLLGEPVSVFGRQAHVTWDLAGEDTATAVLEYANGVSATIMQSWAADAHVSFPQITIWGTKGALKFEAGVLLFNDEPVDVDGPDQFVEMVRTFVRAYSGFGQPKQDLDDAVRAQAICDSFYRSCQSGEAVPALRGGV